METSTLTSGYDEPPDTPLTEVGLEDEVLVVEVEVVEMEEVVKEIDEVVEEGLSLSVKSFLVVICVGVVKELGL